MTITLARWFPAAIQLPGESRPHLRRYIVLADQGEEAGLWVFDRPDSVVFRSAVDYTRTTVPKGRQARNGVDVHLLTDDGEDAGLAIVTVGGGCKCGALGRWGGPSWAGTVVARS